MKDFAGGRADMCAGCREVDVDDGCIGGKVGAAGASVGDSGEVER